MTPKLAFMLAGVLLLGGCLPSLNAVFTDESLVFDPAVVGVWTQPGAKAKWDFTQRDAKSYRLLYTDAEGREGRFIAHLAEIEGTLFVDLFPDKMETGASTFYDIHLVPLHTVYLVRQTEPKLQMASIDYGWLDKFLTEHPDAIQHAVFNGTKLITAPTDELQAFVAQHKDAFNANFELERASTVAN
jgi:hypothetical protein